MVGVGDGFLGEGYLFLVLVLVFDVLLFLFLFRLFSYGIDNEFEVGRFFGNFVFGSRMGFRELFFGSWWDLSM